MYELLRSLAAQRGNGRLLATLLLIIGLSWAGLAVVGFLAVGLIAGGGYWSQVLTMMAFVAGLSVVPFVAAGLVVVIPSLAALLVGSDPSQTPAADESSHPGAEDLMPHDPRDQPEQSADIYPARPPNHPYD